MGTAPAIDMGAYARWLDRGEVTLANCLNGTQEGSRPYGTRKKLRYNPALRLRLRAGLDYAALAGYESLKCRNSVSRQESFSRGHLCVTEEWFSRRQLCVMARVVLTQTVKPFSSQAAIRWGAG